MERLFFNCTICGLICSYDLMKLCNEGPRRRLNDIRYSHVALFTTCLGYVEKLREERPEAVYNCIGTAGFSVGEIAALVFAGSLHFDQGKSMLWMAPIIQLIVKLSIYSSAIGPTESRSNPIGW